MLLAYTELMTWYSLRLPSQPFFFIFISFLLVLLLIISTTVNPSREYESKNRPPAQGLRNPPPAVFCSRPRLRPRSCPPSPYHVRFLLSSSAYFVWRPPSPSHKLPYSGWMFFGTICYWCNLFFGTVCYFIKMNVTRVM